MGGGPGEGAGEVGAGEGGAAGPGARVRGRRELGRGRGAVPRRTPPRRAVQRAQPRRARRAEPAPLPASRCTGLVRGVETCRSARRSLGRSPGTRGWSGDPARGVVGEHRRASGLRPVQPSVFRAPPSDWQRFFRASFILPGRSSQPHGFTGRTPEERRFVGGPRENAGFPPSITGTGRGWRRRPATSSCGGEPARGAREARCGLRRRRRGLLRCGREDRAGGLRGAARAGALREAPSLAALPIPPRGWDSARTARAIVARLAHVRAWSTKMKRKKLGLKRREEECARPARAVGSEDGALGRFPEDWLFHARWGLGPNGRGAPRPQQHAGSLHPVARGAVNWAKHGEASKCFGLSGRSLKMLGVFRAKPRKTSVLVGAAILPA